jgi:hypothetical protein
MKILFYATLCLFSLSAFCATELYLDSPLINLTLPEIELNDPDINHNDPCANIQGANSCTNDAPNKRIIVVYPLVITSNIPSGMMADLHFEFANDVGEDSFEEVELLQSGSPQTSPLNFTSSSIFNYTVRFKIKYKGVGSRPEPRVNINFSMVDSAI